MKSTQSIGRTVAVWILSLTLTLSFAVLCSAQDDGPTWILLSEIQVKPEMRQEWQDLQKNEVNPAFKKAGISERWVWETVVGDLRTYYSVIALENFAQLDEPGPLKRALEPERRIVLLQKLSKCINARKRSTIVLRPDLSIEKEQGSPSPLAVVIEVSLLPGKQKAFESLFKSEVLPALRKAGVQEFLASQTVFGGSPTQLTFLSMIPNFAQLDKGPPLVRALGREGAEKLAEKFAGLTSSVNYTIARFNAELSFRE